jgi:translation machinery-associated protein 16
VDRVAFFQAAVEQSATPLSEEELYVLTARLAGIVINTQQWINFCRYIARDEEEVATLRAQRRPGRPSSNLEDHLKNRIEAEGKEFKSGFWIPDIRDDEGVMKLRAWNRDWSSLNTLKFARIGREGGMRTSTFPPKGLS